MKPIEKYQIFCSSVSKELGDTRAEVISRLMERNIYFPIAMEFFTAYSQTITMLFEFVQQSDIYILILKDDLGTPIGSEGAGILHDLCEDHPELIKELDAFTHRTGLSHDELTFTQIEYIFAISCKLPILTFVYLAEDEISIEKRIKAFNGKGFSHAAAVWKNKSELADKVISSLDNTIRTEIDPMSGWIRKVDSPLFKVTAQVGIRQISPNGSGFVNSLKERLVGAKDLYLLFTTGRGFIVNNQNLLADHISRGGNIKIITGLPGSDFLSDVSFAESKRYGNRLDIHREFDLVVDTLFHIYQKAKSQLREYDTEEALGTIQIAGCETLFRSSIVICDYGEREWGWLTITLPPEKAADMISMELEYPCSNYKNDDDNLLKACKNHVQAIWELAEIRHQVMTLTSERPNTEAMQITKAPGLKNRDYWQKKYEESRSNQKKNRKNDKTLIEVAAQHPLVRGEYPGVEFEARLNEALRIYRQLKERGTEAEIFVPGSIHLDPEGDPELFSLSEAGINWLKNVGVDPSALHGEDLIEKYQGRRNWYGVYNTGDECDIASLYYFEGGFGTLISVCSPNQLMRKSLFYMDHGILAQIVTVPVENMYHNLIDELFDAVPYVLSEDPNIQGKDSKEAVRTRKERMENFKL